MSQVIEFLEHIGTDARLRYATAGEMRRALDEAGVDPAAQAALLGDDRRKLEALTGAQATVCCTIRPVDDEGYESDHCRTDELTAH